MRTRQVVVLLLAFGLLMAGCGGDDDNAGGGGKGTVSGTGYELKLADGWTNATKETEGSVINFDLLALDKGGSFSTNLNVLREKFPDGAGLEDLRKIYRGQLSSLGATNITGTREAAVGGDEAYTYEYDQKGQTGEEVHGRQVAVVHDDHAHTITLTALATKFDAANQEFSEMLRSWRWK